MVSGGDILGYVNENSLFQDHKIMVDPNIQGRIVEIYPTAQYTVAQPICVVETPSGV
jgi:vacuolar-type H+-ATPase catalytic subunit A/Vma1